MAVTFVAALAFASMVGGAISLGLAAVAWRHRTIPAALPFTGLMVAVAGWSFANAGILLAPTANAAFVAERVVRAASAHVAPLWLVFVAAFAGHEEWMTVRNLALLWIYPVVYTVGSLTAPFHGLASTPVEVVPLTKNGITAYRIPQDQLFDLHLLLVHVTILAGFAVLARFVVRSRDTYRKQTVAVVLGTIGPILANAADLLDLMPHPELDPTPVAFVASGVLVAWALVRYGFLSVTPLAGSVLVDELPDPVFVLDERDEITDHNPAAAAAFGVDDPVGDDVETLAPGLLDRIESGAIFRGSAATARADGGGESFYEPNVTHLEDQHGNRRNRLVVLRDVTGQQRRQQRLEALQEATRKFLAASTDEEIAEISVEYADEVLDSHGTTVFLTDGGADRLAPVAMTDATETVFERNEPPEEPVAGALARAYETDEPTTQELPGEVGGAPERALAVPLGEHGVLWVGTTAEDVFAPDDEGFATILARTTQVALTRVERESALRRSRSSVERRSEQIAFFNGVLRHTLRNALLVIQGRAEHLREQVDGAETHHVDTVVDWCDDLADLSEEIRAVNDTVTATESERLDAVDLSAMLGQCVREFERKHAGVTFEMDIDGDLTIEANELASRAIESVLKNAVIHNDRDDPHIEVWTVHAADRIQVHVADDGPGMDDEMKNVVFEQDLSTNQTASGFGLYFVSVLMNLYGGTVWFEDNRPRGTVAVLEFQATEDDDEDTVTSANVDGIDAEID